MGLTGGVASGKSTVAHMLEAMGATWISADEIVHALLAPGTETSSQVAREFGSEVLSPSGGVDRGKLGTIVFSDVEKRRRLEAILHPIVMKEISSSIERFRDCGSGVLVVEVPLLVEIGAARMFDKILVVSAEQESQISRLHKRCNLNRDEAELRLKAQLPMKDKMQFADWVISTEGTLADTRTRVERLWCDIQECLALGE
ncbi:MAG: dephospho-CoA kinase [Armatimonadetes bacterium]|nr:dephospho-CoA kinase [Armatimonadota bacterium]